MTRWRHCCSLFMRCQHLCACQIPLSISCPRSPSLHPSYPPLVTSPHNSSKEAFTASLASLSLSLSSFHGAAPSFARGLVTGALESCAASPRSLRCPYKISLIFHHPRPADVREAADFSLWGDFLSTALFV